MRTTQEPTKDEGASLTGRTVYSHPAFGIITASRISGQTNLFGSNVGHSGFVRISIFPAKLHRDGYSDFIHGSIKPIIEVNLSEAQWVSFISRMNMGDGTPVTITDRAMGETVHVPGLPDMEKATERLESQIEDMVGEAEKKAKLAEKELMKLLEERLPKKVLAEAQSLMTRIGVLGEHAREFQRECLTETKEKLVAESRIEIDAMLTGAVTKLGLESVQQLGMILAANPQEAMKLLASKAPDEE